MLLSKVPLSTQRDFPKEAHCQSHRWLARAGYTIQHGAGLYSFSPLLTRAFRKIEALVDQFLEASGCVQVTFPIAQPRELWDESGRWAQYIASETMFHTTNRQGAEYALAPTSEEIAVDFARRIITSARQLPVTYYQHGRKFRDELRPRSGLLRGREFQMMDAYSFCATDEQLRECYAALREAFIGIFNRIGLDYRIVRADNGDMGGSSSEEFMALSDAGEDTILIDQDGNAANVEVASLVGAAASRFKAIEIGHIFQLGTKYTEAMNFKVNTGQGMVPVTMGCYGIGTSRLLAATVEQHCDSQGICWPAAIAPFQYHIVQIGGGEAVQSTVAQLQGLLQRANVEALVDDRAFSAGIKLADADMLGMPTQVIVGKKAADGLVEVKDRKTGKVTEIRPDELIK